MRRRRGPGLVGFVVFGVACSSNSVVLPTTAANTSQQVAASTSASSAAPSSAVVSSTGPSSTVASSTSAPTTTAPSTVVSATTPSGTAASSPPTTETPDDPVLDSGKVDADVVVEAFDTLRFDKDQYRGKADLTLGLFDQGSMPHTLVIEGRESFKLEVGGRGDSSVGDILLRRGTYTMYCELPGHRAGGMEATLVIS